MPRCPDVHQSKTTLHVGSKLHFGIEISNQISNIEFSVTDCTVKNKQHGLEYGILNNQCANKRVKFKIFDNLDSKLTKFSYRVFEFRQARAKSLHLSCNVLVCDVNDENSKCKSGGSGGVNGSCGSRRRRHAEFLEEDKVYRISQEILLKN